MSAINEARPTPYRGLTPFAEADAQFFFGREPEREIITANLLASPLTLLYGESGVGKSSVLRAGVAHHLRRLARQNLAESGRPDVAVVVFSSWRDDPVTALVKRVEQSVELILGKTSDGNPELAATDGPVETALTRAAERVSGEVLVILDQFEEYFLYHPRDEGPGSFAAAFARAVTSSSLPASFLLSIREDALAQLDRFKGRVPALFDNYYRIQHLSRDAAHAAIVRPLEEYNRLSAGVPVEIEPDLVEAVLDEVAVREGGDAGFGPAGVVAVATENARPARDSRVETPYLQLVMTHVWNAEMGGGSRRLQLSTLKRLGSGREILRRHLDEAMAAITPKERQLAARVFHYLVTPSGTKIALSVSDLAAWAKVEEGRLGPVLRRLADSDTRILRSFAPIEGDKAHIRYEIFHDLLAKAVLDWRLRYSASRERRRVTRGALGVVALLTLVATVLAVYALQQRRAAEDEAATALAERRIASPLLKGLLLGHTAPVLRAEFSPDGRFVVSASADETARVWRAGTGNLVAVLRGHTGPVRSAVFSRDGALVVTGGADGKARVWETRTGRAVSILSGHTGPINTVAVGRFGRRIVTASEDGTARVWALSDRDGDRVGRLALVLNGHDGNVASAVFDAVGNRILTAGADGTARIWGAARGKERVVFEGHQGAVQRASFSGDGKLVLTAGTDGTARVWDAASGRQRLVLRGHRGAVNGAAFSSQHRLVVTAGEDGTARIWETATGRKVAVLIGHSDRVNRAVFGQEGRIVATASNDGSARLWRTSGESLNILSGHRGPVLSIALSRDGLSAVTAGADRTVRTWIVPAAKE